MPDLNDVIKLREAIDRELKKLHVNRIVFAFVPAEDGSSDSVQLTLTIPAEAFLSQDELEQANIDSKFKDLVFSFEEDPEQAKIKELKSSIEDDIADFFKDDE